MRLALRKKRRKDVSGAHQRWGAGRVPAGPNQHHPAPPAIGLDLHCLHIASWKFLQPFKARSSAKECLYESMNLK